MEFGDDVVNMINMDNKARLFRAPVEHLSWIICVDCPLLLSELKKHQVFLYNADMI